MSTFPPILVAMAKDRRLRPTDIQVYIIASAFLDFDEYRPLKLFTVAHELRLDVSNVAKSMRNLMRCGYLDRGARSEGGGAWTFRRVPSSRVAKSTTAQPGNPSPEAA